MKLIFLFLALCFQAFANYEFNLLKHENDKIYATIKQDGKAVTFKDLKTVHEKKLHVFVVSEDLEFYTHVHPKEEGSGVFSFSVNNLKKNKNYRVWGEFTAIKNSELNYVFFDIINVKAQNVLPLYSASFQHNGITFKLSFEENPKEGEDAEGAIEITKKGVAFNNLETIMGEKAHLVGFINSNKNIAHIHPMGFEEGKLMFHISFKEKGFAKLFAQFKIDGEEVIVPFGFRVN